MGGSWRSRAELNAGSDEGSSGSHLGGGGLAGAGGDALVRHSPAARVSRAGVG
jgi:hypothetical protein